MVLIVGVAGPVFPVKIDANKPMGHLKRAIHDLKPLPVTSEPDSLQLFLAKTEDGAWLNSNDPLLLRIRKGDCPCEGVIHVLVVVPGIVYEDVVWYGSVGEEEAIDLNDERTLTRSAQTAAIIDRLDETHVVLVQSPPMTGKTILATLLCQALVDKHKEEEKKKKAVVCSFSVSGMSEIETFEGLFKKRCKLDWVYAKGVLPTRDRAVYLVLDEAQLIYNDSASTFIAFWELVKLVQIDAAHQVRIVMFADYGFNVEYTRHGTSIGCDDRMVFGVAELNFKPTEVSEYVSKWFQGAEGLSPSDTMETFSATLQELTGGHVGLCMSAIDALNKVYDKNSSDPHTWIRMLQGGWLYEPGDGALFKALTQTRAVKILETLGVEDLNRLERAVCGVNPWSNADIVEQCLHNGILVRSEWQLNFSSPVMWRYFVKLRVGRIPRALDAPKSLSEMIARVMAAMDYTSVHQELCSTFLPNDTCIPTWQLEFYKAVYRCTPSSFVTSADVGALFGSSGFVDFTINTGRLLWGIELLREASNLAERIERFSPGGRYASLGLTEFSLVDFRCVASIDSDKMERIAADMQLCDKLVVACYDEYCGVQFGLGGGLPGFGAARLH